MINAKFFKFNLKFVHLYELESKLRTVFDKVSNIMFSLNNLFLFLGMGRTWEKSELFSNFFVNISTFKVRPCFASPGKIPQIPQNEQKDQRRRSVWVGHDKFLKIG